MKRKTTFVYILIIGLFIILAAMLDNATPKQFQWTPDYYTDGKNPYDLKVFKDQLEHIADLSKVEFLDSSFYQLYNDNKNFSKTDSNTLILFVGNAPEWDKESVTSILDFVSKGNDLFISADDINDKLLNNIQIKFNSSTNYNVDSIHLKLYHNQENVAIETKHTTSNIKNKSNRPIFILGFHKEGNNKDSLINFIRVPYKKGNIYIHSVPTVFTNYQLLYGGTSNYISQILGYTKKKHLIFFTNDYFFKTKVSTTPLRYVLSQPTLRWAWFIGLMALFLFMLFNAKRKQRVVPVIQPLKNTTLAYTFTISDLFHELEGNEYIFNKKTLYFLEYIRKKYIMDTADLSRSFIQNLSRKSQVDHDLITQIIQVIQSSKTSNKISDDTLIKLDQLIDRFKQQENSFSKP